MEYIALVYIRLSLIDIQLVHQISRRHKINQVTVYFDTFTSMYKKINWKLEKNSSYLSIKHFDFKSTFLTRDKKHSGCTEWKKNSTVYTFNANFVKNCHEVRTTVEIYLAALKKIKAWRNRTERMTQPLYTLAMKHSISRRITK